VDLSLDAIEHPERYPLKSNSDDAAHPPGGRAVAGSNPVSPTQRKAPHLPRQRDRYGPVAFEQPKSVDDGHDDDSPFAAIPNAGTRWRDPGAVTTHAGFCSRSGRYRCPIPRAPDT